MFIKIKAKSFFSMFTLCYSVERYVPWLMSCRWPRQTLSKWPARMKMLSLDPMLWQPQNLHLHQKIPETHVSQKGQPDPRGTNVTLAVWRKEAGKWNAHPEATTNLLEENSPQNIIILQPVSRFAPLIICFRERSILNQEV